MELIEIRNYDEHKSYGVDWITEYRCKSDTEIPLKETLENLEKLGHKVYGEITQSYNETTKELIVTTRMY